MSLIRDISKDKLYEFLDSIQIDPGFMKFIDFAKSNYNAKIYILSDGFRLFIKRILKNHLSKIDGIFSNRLYLINKSFKTSYPHTKNDCPIGVCKCSLYQKLKTEKAIYIGDGRSDFCIGGKADFVFAKGKLKTYLESKNVKNFISFSCFEDIINQLPLLENVNGRKGTFGS